jgi:hypothetical protein
MKITIDIREIFYLYERMKTINNLNIMDIEFADGVDEYGKPYVISLDDGVKQRFADTGLSNMDFITSNYYLMKGE